MSRRYHFISGLPRAGSTVLSALLRQNPRFSAGVASPVAMLCGNLLHGMSGATEFAPFFTDERRAAILRAVFDSYYADVPPGSVIFDSNRSWTGRADLLATLFPGCWIICCVREVSWVLDSVERLVRRNALQPSRLFNYRPGASVYARVEMLMDPEKGLVGLAWSGLREAWFADSASRLILIRYEELARNPRQALQRLYELLGEPGFAHDFDNLAFEEPAYDAEIGLPGLHTVRPKVELHSRRTCLPPDLFAKYTDVNFWLNSKLNRHRVPLL